MCTELQWSALISGVGSVLCLSPGRDFWGDVLSGPSSRLETIFPFQLNLMDSDFPDLQNVLQGVAYGWLFTGEALSSSREDARTASPFPQLCEKNCMRVLGTELPILLQDQDSSFQNRKNSIIFTKYQYPILQQPACVIPKTSNENQNQFCNLEG